MNWTLVLVVAIASTACESGRVVKVGWDVPANAPDGYRVLVDERSVLDIPPPPVDPACSCLAVKVRVPEGQHTVKVIAYTNGGASSSAASLVVQ